MRLPKVFQKGKTALNPFNLIEVQNPPRLLIAKSMNIDKNKDVKLVYFEFFEGNYYVKIPTEIPTGSGEPTIDLRYEKLTPNNPYYSYFKKIQDYKGMITKINYEPSLHLAKSLIIKMTPETFLYYAISIKSKKKDSDHYIPSYDIDSLNSILDRLIKNQKLWNPSFTIEKGTNEVSGHEGRHRSLVFYHLGIKEMFVNLRLDHYVFPDPEYTNMNDYEAQLETSRLITQKNALEKIWDYQRKNANPPKYLFNKEGLIVLKKEE